MAMTMVIAMAASSITGCGIAARASQTGEAETSVSGQSDQDTAEAGDTESILTEEMMKAASIKGSSRTSIGKSETVYVMTDAAGTAQKVIVSDWLKNSEGAETIKDKTSLKDVENVKGDEDYTLGEDGTITWNAKGNDIYYQGTTDAQLPVDISITYYLDGKEISGQDLIGKSGALKIRYDYVNRTSKAVDINGTTEVISAPFAVVTGLIMPDDHFTNIEVTNGKVISDGEKQMVVGMAIPGLKESLKLT